MSRSFGIARGGGGTSTNVDTSARAGLTTAQEQIKEMLRDSGDVIKPDEEVFIKLSSGKSVNFVNTKTVDVTVPATKTVDAFKTAGLVRLADPAVAMAGATVSEAQAFLDGTDTTSGSKVVTLSALNSVKDSLGDELSGEAATFAALPAAKQGKYAFLTADNVGTGTVSVPQYPKGIYKADVTPKWVSVLAVTSGSASITPRVTIRATATATDTDVVSEKAIRTALDALAVPTLRLAAGGTPAANGIYVQAIGDTHVTPVLTSGQRTTVISLQTGGGAIERTYLHDGVAQSVMTAAASSPAEVTVSTTALSGTAPTGSKFGYNSTTNTLYMVVSGSWQAIPTVNASDVRFAATAPDAGNTTQTVWVDVSAARWPVYSRAMATDAWPTTATGYIFETAVANGTVKDVTDRVTAGRAWTPEIISDVLRDNDANRFKHYKAGDTIDFNALHTAANTKAIRMYSFTSGVNLTNPPQVGASLGVTGHGYYIGDADNGQQFVYFLDDALGRETEYYRERGGATWTNWHAVSSDGWQGSQNDMQISSGMHIVIADGHKVHFLASDRVRAIRLIPDSDWSKVGTITPGNSWTFDGEFPTSGRQEVVLVPAPVADVWNVSAMIAADVKKAFIQRTTSTSGSEPTSVEFADPANGDSVAVLLSNDVTEIWKYAADAWTQTASVQKDATIPTVQAGLGAAVKIDDYGRPSNIHLNSATGAVTWAVGGAPDGVWHYITNTGTVDASVTFTGHKNVYLRDGRANTDLTATLATKPGEQYLVHVTKNGEDRYVNAARLSTASPATTRTITGDATATGYENIAVPVVYTLPAGKFIDTVTATNGATVGNINPILGTFMVTAKTDNTVLTVKTKPAATYTGLQLISEYRPAAPVDIEASTIATGLKMNTASELRVICQHSTAGTYSASGTVNPLYATFVVDLERLRNGANGYAWLSLDGGYLQLRVTDFATGAMAMEDQGQGGQLVAVQVWDNAANGYVVPTGTEVRQGCDVSVNGGAVNINGSASVKAYAGTSMRAMIALLAGERLTNIAASNGATVTIVDALTGAVELALPAGTTGAIALTATIGAIIPHVARRVVAVNAGVTVDCGTIQVRMSAAGNRSMQVRSTTGTISCSGWTVWDSGGSTTAMATTLSETWGYASTTPNFGTAGAWQEIFFIDATNNRTYEVRMIVGASYVGNGFLVKELI